MPTETATQTAASPIASRLEGVRRLAETDPEAAQLETWAWFAEAGRRIQTDRDAALGELSDLFRSGSPSTGIDGPTEGALVGFTLHPAFDRATAALARRWLPWAAKRFDSAAARGDNLMLRSARWPSKLLWPRYPMRGAGEHLAGFDFETRVEPGALDPDREVLVIDYAAVEANPRLIIKSVRDELVEVVPGAHLGKVLWRRGQGADARHTLLAYFALKSEVAPSA